MKNIIYLFVFFIPLMGYSQTTDPCDKTYVTNNPISVSEPNTAKLRYRVQVMEIHSRTPDKGFHKGLMAIHDRCRHTWKIVTVQSVPTKREAIQLVRTWVERGYKEAFYIEEYSYGSLENQLPPTVSNNTLYNSGSYNGERNEEGSSLKYVPPVINRDTTDSNGPMKIPSSYIMIDTNNFVNKRPVRTEVKPKRVAEPYMPPFKKFELEN